ncbi:hypothetical protein [Falsiroseomonas sp. CW058]|uniref:hypothetical protein n=1 Tax=Falsiroseomonas sp. CW058 TaxID=3388664 RepID=UPI003D311223
MRFMAGMALAFSLGLGLPGLATAQSNPMTGMGAGQIHGQRPDMRQDLHNAPGAPAASLQATTPQAPQTRTQQLRRQSQAAQRQQAQQQQRRVAQHRAQAEAGQATRRTRTGTGPQAGRSPDSMAAHEARMADARRRQMEAEERAARAFPGVR